MPFLLQRFQAQANNPATQQFFPKGFLPEAARFWYYTAQVPNRAAMLALREVVPVTKILFGTDAPFGTGARTAKGLIESSVFTPEELAAIDRGNALELMPHYRS